jgi:hypothetical protein
MLPFNMAPRHRRATAAGLIVALFGSLISVASVSAAATVTPATGGTGISADNAGTAVWTTLTGPVVTESAPGDFGTGTVILTLPTGFVFNNAVGSVAASAGPCDITPASPALSYNAQRTTVAFTITGASSAASCSYTWSGLQVQPASGTPLSSGSITESGTATGLPTDSYGALSMVVGAADHLAFQSYPAPETPALLTPQPTVVIFDRHGNLVTTDARVITLTTNTGTSTFRCFAQSFGTVPAIAAVGGIASFTACTQSAVGTGYILTADDGAGGLPAIVGPSFNVTSGVASALRLCWGATTQCVTTPPTNATGGIAFSTQPVVRIVDSLGNTVPTDSSSTVAISIASGTPTSGGPGRLTCPGGTQVTVINGVGAFDGCRIDVAGNAYKLTAVSNPVLTAATSNAFNVAVGPPVRLAFVAEPASAPAGGTMAPPPAVAIEDAGGNVVTSGYVATIALSIGANPVSGSLSCPNNNVATTVNGLATFNGCGIDKQGFGYTLIATATSITPMVALSTAQTSPFTVGPAGPSLAISASSGAIVWGNDVTLTVHFGGDGANRTVGIQVSKDGTTWSTISGAAALTTDANGDASFVYGPSDNRYYRASFAGAADLGPGFSQATRVVVRQTNSLRPAPTSLPREIAIGAKVAFTSTVRPNRPELPPAHVDFRVFQLVGGRWQQVIAQTLGVNASGVATLTVTFAISGQFYVRSQATPTTSNANSGWSPVVNYVVH